MLVVADDEDGEALNIETAMGELRDHVMANDQLTHRYASLQFLSYDVQFQALIVFYHHAEGYLRVLPHRHRRNHH